MYSFFDFYTTFYDRMINPTKYGMPETTFCESQSMNVDWLEIIYVLNRCVVSTCKVLRMERVHAVAAVCMEELIAAVG